MTPKACFFFLHHLPVWGVSLYIYVYIEICISSQMIHVFASNNTWYAWLTLNVWFFSLSCTYFFFLQERDTLSKNILNSDIKIILKTKLIRNFASFFSAWFGEAYETRRPQYSKFISFKLQDLVTLASCCYPLPANQEQWNPRSGGFRIRYSGRQDQRQVHSSHKSCQPPNSSFGTAHHQTSRWWIS